MIKKILPSLFLSVLPLCTFAAGNEAFLDLDLTEQFGSQNRSYAVSLDSLKENILYKLTCNLNNTENHDEKIMFEPRLLASSSYGNVQLNYKPLSSNSGYLKKGANLLSFQLLVGKADIDRYNRFVLTSFSDASIQVSQCKALELSPTSTSENLNSDGGFFYAYNDTDNPVTIAVGNLWLTEYDIQPHDWRMVFVSTNNQNIRIKPTN